MRTLVWTCCAWFFFVGTVRGEEPTKSLPPEIEKLVSEHEATWAKIKTLDVEFETTVSAWSGANLPSPRTFAGRWILGEDIERLALEHWVLAADRSYGTGLSEWSVIGDESRTLAPRIDGSEKASFGDESNARRSLSLHGQQWMRRFAVEMGGPMTLREIASRWTTSIEEAGRTNEGDRLTALEFVPPADVAASGSFVRVYLNLDKGCLVHRVDQLFAHGGLAKSYAMKRPELTSVGNVGEAASYRDYGGGIFLPEKVCGYCIVECVPDDFDRRNRWHELAVWKVLSARINEPLEASLSDPIAPQGTIADSFGAALRPEPLTLRR